MANRFRHRTRSHLVSSQTSQISSLYVCLWNTSRTVICIKGGFLSWGASWICSIVPKGQASPPGYSWTLERLGSPLKCKGHYFPDITAGSLPSYTALSAWFDGKRRLSGILQWRVFLKYISTTTTYNMRLSMGTDTNLKVWLPDRSNAGMYPQ